MSKSKTIQRRPWKNSVCFFWEGVKSGRWKENMLWNVDSSQSLSMEEWMGKASRQIHSFLIFRYYRLPNPHWLRGEERPGWFPTRKSYFKTKPSEDRRKSLRWNLLFLLIWSEKESDGASFQTKITWYGNAYWSLTTKPLDYPNNTGDKMLPSDLMLITDTNKGYRIKERAIIYAGEVEWDRKSVV